MGRLCRDDQFYRERGRRHRHPSEKIALSLDKNKCADGPCIEGIVTALEYKGGVTRIYAASSKDKKTICADIGSDVSQSWALRGGMTVYMTLPREHIKIYDAPVAV